MDTGHAHARYRELLYRHGHGYPFWVPEPDPRQRSKSMEPGDVGILNDDGGFDYLWNIHLPKDDDDNTLAPPNFERVELRDVRRTDLFFPRKTAINSTFVKKREINIGAGLDPAIVGGIVGGGAGFEFTAEGNSGAILALPRGGERSNSLRLNMYLRHATKNAESWYRHVNQELDRGIRSGTLFLVTGTDKCSSWGVASFANPSGSHGGTLKFMAFDVASFHVSVRNSWSASFGEHREKVVDRSELSQCVFARGFVISVRDSFLAQICAMQVKVTSLDGSRLRPHSVGHNRPFSRGAGSSANIDVRRLPDNQPQKSVAALLGEELLNQNGDAVIAIVHDEDWISSTQSGDFLETRDPSNSFLEDLVHHAATNSRAVVIDGICKFATANLMRMTNSRGSQLKDLTASLTVDARKSASGGHSDLYKGRLTLGGDGTSTYVAVKFPRYTPAQLSEAILRDLENEMEIWSDRDHPNVLPLLGFYRHGDILPGVVSPWCDDGSVIEYLKSARDGPTKRVDGPIENGSFALLWLEAELLSQVANGLEYLHGQNIIHGDIKGSNILVQDGIARLYDFGHSVFDDEKIDGEDIDDKEIGETSPRSGNPKKEEIGETSPRFGTPKKRLATGAHRSRDGDTSTSLGTPRWLAPELDGFLRAHCTREADIWAFGCVLLEVRTLHQPWYGCAEESAVGVALVSGCWPYSYPDSLHTKLWNLAAHCWSHKPEGRPTSQVISARLKDVISSLEVLKDTFVSSGDLPLNKRHSLWLAFARMCREASSNLGQALGGVGTVINALESVGERYPSTMVRPSARAMARRDPTLADQLMTKLSDSRLRLCYVTDDVAARQLLSEGRSRTSLAFLSDGRRLIYTSGTDLRIWDIGTGETVIGPLPEHTGHNRFAVHASRIASCSGRTFCVWDADNGDLVFGPITAHNDKSVKSIAYSGDGTHIATAGSDDWVVLWDARRGIRVRVMVGHTAHVECVAFSEDGTRLVSGSAERECTVRIWDVASGKCVGNPMNGHTKAVHTVCFSPDGKRIFSSSDDGTIRMWDAETRATIEIMRDVVGAMALSPDGAHLVSGSTSGEIVMWDAETGAAIPTHFKDRRGELFAIAFSPDGRIIASLSQDIPGEISLWDATDDWKRWDIDDMDVDEDNA